MLPDFLGLRCMYTVKLQRGHMMRARTTLTWYVCVCVCVFARACLVVVVIAMTEGNRACTGTRG